MRVLYLGKAVRQHGRECLRRLENPPSPACWQAPVFATKGRALSTRQLRNWWYLVCKRSGIDEGPHCHPHTARPGPCT